MMKWLKKILRFIFYAFAGVLLLLLVGHYVSVSGNGTCEVEGCTDSVDFFIVDKGIHTAIVLPVKGGGVDWTEFIELDEINPYGGPPYEYLEFGWGERDFFINTPTWSEVRVGVILKALFLSTESVMHVTGYRSSPVRGSIRQVRTCKHKYQKMATFVRETFYTDEGALQYVSKGYHRHDGFYKANPSYHLFYQCNNWTANALKIAGFSTPLIPLFPTSIFRHLR